MEQRTVIRLAPTRPTREGSDQTGRTLPGIPAGALTDFRLDGSA